MSAVGLEPTDNDVAEARRWAACLGVIVALHALVAVVLAWWLGPVTLIPMAQPPAAVMLDMAPGPAKTAPRPTETLGGRTQRRVLSPRRPDRLRQPNLPRVREAEAATPIVKDGGPHTHDKTPAPEMTAPATAAGPPARVATPARDTPKADVNAAPTWEGLVLSRLEQVKRYPTLARMRAQQGVVYLRFTMNRDGRVLTAKIERGSGYDLLDEEALALVRRAEPLPKPPPEVAGDTLQLVVPIQFFLSGGR